MQRKTPKKVKLARKRKPKYRRLHGTKVLVGQVVVLGFHSTHPLAHLSGKRATVRIIGRQLDGVGCNIAVELEDGSLVDAFEKFMEVVQ